MAPTLTPPRLLCLLSIILSFIHQTSTAELSDGFSIQLIHHDSPLSPYYNPNATLFDRWKASYERSLSRLHHLKRVTGAATPSPQALHPPLTSFPFEYLMKLGIGNPPVTVYLALDTSSGLIWVQCAPCNSCYVQNEPIFDPAKSSSHLTVGCQAGYCIALKKRGCESFVCTYSLEYTDRRASSGELGVEWFTVPRPTNEDDRNADDRIILYDVVFGCGHKNTGPFQVQENGVAGFNMAPTSFMSQLGSRLQFRFSYCFADPLNSKASGQLLLGNGAVLSGNATKLAEPEEDMYYLNLTDISVGGVELGIPPETFRRDNNKGGVILDSTTALTHLNGIAYFLVISYLKEEVKLERTQGYKDMVCYKGSSKDLSSGNIPDITFHFDGLDVPVKPQSSFAETKSGVICLMMSPSVDLTIIGNLFQRNLHVGFNTIRKKVYMVPADCTNSIG